MSDNRWFSGKRMLLKRKIALPVAAATLVAAAFPAAAEDVTRLIVKFRDAGAKAAMAPSQRVARLGDEAGLPLVHARAMAQGAHVARLGYAVPLAVAERIAARLSANPDV